MAQRIRCALATVILLLSLASFASAQSTHGAVEKNVVIVLSKHIKIPPGSYNAVVQVSGENVSVQLKIPSIPISPELPESKKESKTGAPGPPPTKKPFISQPPWFGTLLAAVITAFLIGIGAWVYLKIIRPRKQMQPYREALALLHEKRYEEALPLLTRVESKLSDSLRRDARFFIAFANFQLHNYQEAELILAALHREDQKDPNSAYLLAYLLVKSERYDDAEHVLERMEANGQLHLHHAKKIVGIVKFHRALAALKDSRVDAAGELFEKVQALGDFASQIPADLRNRHIVLGTTALFDKNLPEARKQFESLQNAVKSLPQEQRNTLLATAKLGLALVNWLEDDSDGHLTIENLLVETAKLLDPQCDIEMAWSAEAATKDVVEKLKDLDAEADLPPEKKEVNYLLRDIHFLRGMAILRAWRKMKAENAHTTIKAQYESALARFACARSRDEEFSDVYLVVGLLMYYFHKPGQKERNHGVDLLQQAQNRGMRDPDAMEIINNRERIEKANASAVDKYLQLLDRYLNNDTVRREVRLALMEHLTRYKRIQNWEKRPDLARARNVEPTVAEMRNRSEVLLDHIQEIIVSRGESAETARVRELSQAIVEDSGKLYEQAKMLENKESELLVETGNQLFKD